MNIETILSPQELPNLPNRDLSRSNCVVFDILRATSTFVTALFHGAEDILPVCEIGEAIAQKNAFPHILLAGERGGLRIQADKTGGMNFDFGNSPREFINSRIAGKNIVSTTTNGTRALQACSQAESVLACAYLNLNATSEYLLHKRPNQILLVCAGTGSEVADEDVLAAGALIERLKAHEGVSLSLSNSSWAALAKHQESKSDWPAALFRSKNGQRLSAMSDLREDVIFCGQTDIFPITVTMGSDGKLRLSRLHP